MKKCFVSFAVMIMLTVVATSGAWAQDLTNISSNPAYLVLYDLPVATIDGLAGPENRYVGDANLVALDVIAGGPGAISYQWISAPALLITNDTFANATVDILAVPVGQYIITCDVTNDLGTVTSNQVILNVLGLPTIVVTGSSALAPAFVWNVLLADTLEMYNGGYDAIFTATVVPAVGGDPIPTMSNIRWFRADTTIPANQLFDGGSISGAITNVLTINPTVLADVAVPLSYPADGYSCVANLTLP